MGKLYKDLPSIDLPCVCLRFYGLSYYHSFRLLYRTQTQQQLGCYSRAACMQGATAESLLLLQILSHLYWETLSSKKGLQYSDLWTVNADIKGKWFPEMNEVQEVSMMAAFLYQLSYLYSALSHTLMPPSWRMYGSVTSLLKCFLHRKDSQT